MFVVIDTNVLVSSLLSKNGSPAKIIGMIIAGLLIPCYDHRILCEYKEVLLRPKFGFTKAEIFDVLNWIELYGVSVIPESLNVDFKDDNDKKFYEVAKFCNAKLITGNLKHFPKDENIVSVKEFLDDYNEL